MTNASHTNEPQHLYEMSWAYTPSSIFAFDSGTGILIDANPAAEALSKYSREELIGLSITMLHPEDERERVLAEYLKPGNQPTPHPDLHLQCKDGRCIPIRSSTSKSVLLDGRTISICVYLDITDRVAYEHQLSTQNWALSAYALAALALGQVRPSEELLLQAICDAITYKSIYVLAWIGVMEEGPEVDSRCREGGHGARISGRNKIQLFEKCARGTGTDGNLHPYRKTASHGRLRDGSGFSALARTGKEVWNMLDCVHTASD
jgi:PAS domain S-box-containing protein